MLLLSPDLIYSPSNFILPMTLVLFADEQMEAWRTASSSQPIVADPGPSPTLASIPASPTKTEAGLGSTPHPLERPWSQEHFPGQRRSGSRRGDNEGRLLEPKTGNHPTPLTADGLQRDSSGIPSFLLI